MGKAGRKLTFLFSTDFRDIGETMSKTRLEMIVYSIPLKCSGSCGFDFDVQDPPEGVELPIDITQKISVCTPYGGSSREKARVVCPYYYNDTNWFERPHICKLSKGASPGPCKYCFDPKSPATD